MKVLKLIGLPTYIDEKYHSSHRSSTLCVFHISINDIYDTNSLFTPYGITNDIFVIDFSLDIDQLFRLDVISFVTKGLKDLLHSFARVNKR